jgi:DNA-binding Lrp family transcriptional regulator
MMDPLDKQLIGVLEEGLPLVAAPFAGIGSRLGISEREVIDRISALREQGVIRKFRARIDQRKLGITANALVAWKGPRDSHDELGPRLASFPSVTHCYERRPVPGRWEYTHYTVHHGYSRDEVLSEVERIASDTGCPEFRVLFSTREYKRVPNVRINENGGGG